MGKAAPFIPALISAGGSIAGGALSMGGKGGGDSHSAQLLTDEQTRTAQFARGLAEEQAARSRPLLNRTGTLFNDFLKTGVMPSFLDLPAQAPQLASLSLPALANQQTQIRQQMINQGIRGGQLQQGLSNLALQGGLQRTGLMQQDLLSQAQRDIDRATLRQRLFGAAADFGSTGVGQAFQGLNTATGGFGSALQANLGMQQLQQQQNIMASQGAGQLLGKGLSTGVGFLPSSMLQGSILGSKLKV